MLEVARVLGFLAAILLLVAVGAWIKLFRSPQLRKLDGSAAKAGNAEIASQLLALSAALSAVAAALAVAGWISP
jgi:UPF0716 family protein affecting phage T7 exclusion